jgi:fatty-acyl-CoA synthase
MEVTMLDATTYPQLLRAAVTQDPDKVFLHATLESGRDAAMTYRHLDDRSRRVAAGLLARGLRPGDRIAIAGTNLAEWMEVFFGATRIGVVVVTLNVRYRQHELDYMLNQSGARLVVSAASADGFDFEEFYAGFRDRIPTVEGVYFLGGGSEGQRYRDLLREPTADEQAQYEQAVTPADPAVILYTSGTTGTPKGAVLTHASLLGSAGAQVKHLGTNEDDVHLCLLPLNHVGGITCNVTAALLSHATVVLAETFSPGAALTALARYRVTVFLGVPTMWNLILAHPSLPEHGTETLRLAVIGGSNVEPALARRIADTFSGARLANLYGLSEVSGAAVISAAGDDVGTVSRSIGIALPGVTARVVGLDGAEITRSQEGELQLSGPGTATGYWQMPDETAHTFLPGGWVATGDMVSQNTDGHLILRGRRKEMFLQGGYNVYPVEVENVLTAHPGVAMAAGIGVPDAVLGEVGCYYIVPRAEQSVTEDELRTHCAAHLADYKVPRHFVLATELPTTPAGKINKSALRTKHDAHGAVANSGPDCP